MRSLQNCLTGPRDPERPAVVGPDGTLVWSALLDRARRLAAYLGPHPSPVMIYGHKQPAMVAGVLAALRLGRPYMPVDSITPPGRISRMLAIAEPTHVVLAEDAPPALASELAARRIATIALDPLATNVPEPHGDAPVSPPDPESSAYVLFTSGTTGDPKGVPIPRAALEHFVDWLLATHRFVPGGETFLNQAPLSFDLSVMDLYGALATGGTLFTVSRDEIADARRLFARLDGAPLTAWVSTPSFARFCLAEPRFDEAMLPALRRFLFCGETLGNDVARQLLARFPVAEVWNMYGPTETTVAVTATRITEAEAASDEPLPVGRAAPGIDVWIADWDDPMRRRPPGVDGEIIIAGRQVAADYLGRPSDAAPEARRAGPFFIIPDGRRAYRSGDSGSLDASHMLFCAGRLDRQIKLHGYRIELEEVEAHLRAVDGVSDAAVLTVDRGGRPDFLVAFVVGDGREDSPLPEHSRPLTRQVRDALAGSLPPYALPRVVRRVPALPLTANGKIDRHTLAEMLG